MAPEGDAKWAASDPDLADRLGHVFAYPVLLEQALAHRSWCSEHGARESNERLEFLGDAVLGLIVADHTFRMYPELPDGVLSKVRASVVNARVLADLARELEISEHLRLGKGEDASGGRDKESILADTMEAIIGAVYIDGGMDSARDLVIRRLAHRISVAVGEPGESDHKSRLQEEAVRLGRGVPHYEVQGSGPDHARRYLATVYVAGERLGTGDGRSKKDAEQVAAQVACGSLEAEKGGDSA